MTILAAMQAVQDAMALLSGIKSAPDYAGPVVFPATLVHLSTGTITLGNPTGDRTELNNIVIELHVSASGSLADAYAVLETLHPLVVAALVLDTTWGGTLQTFSNVTYTTGQTSWGGSPTLARFYILNGCKVIA